MRRRPRKNQAGLTLIELMVGATIGLFMTVTAIAFARHSIELNTATTERIDLADYAEISVDLLVDDLRRAGQGVGYDGNGFAGLLVGTFTVGGASFGTTSLTLAKGDLSAPLENATYALSTRDIGIRRANGSYATIANFDLASGAGQFCVSPGVSFGSNELVVLREESGLAAMTARIAPGTVTSCSWGQCVGGCQAFTWTSDPSFESASGASSLNYRGGEIHGGFETIVWFIVDGEVGFENRGVLRRAVFDGNTTCTARNSTCGGIVAQGVETLQYEVWQWDTTAGAWQRFTGSTPYVAAQSRLRVDVELVVRARKPDSRQHASVPLRLGATGCVPSGSSCGQAVDFIERQVHRASVEVKNSGRMVMRF